MKGAFTS